MVTIVSTAMAPELRAAQPSRWDQFSTACRRRWSSAWPWSAAEKLGASIVVGFFLANVPQGLSSVSGMKTAGRSRMDFYAVWGAISASIAVSAAIGAALLDSAPHGVPSAILAFAAGAVLATLSEVVIPEAFDHAPPLIGLVTALGFIAAYTLLQSHA